MLEDIGELLQGHARKWQGDCYRGNSAGNAGDEDGCEEHISDGCDHDDQKSGWERTKQT